MPNINLNEFILKDLWIGDILSNKYEDVPTVKISADPLYPCVEQDALVGVYFSPTVISNTTQTSNVIILIIIIFC
jgi:hypothetical protein